MTSDHRDSEDILRLIDDLSADADHTDQEARAALEEAGVDSDALVRAVRHRAQTMLARDDRRSAARPGWFRNVALGLVAASAAMFVVAYHVDTRASTEASRQLARAELLGPLLPALASEDADSRSAALTLANQIDPGFASATSAQMARWDISREAQARAGRNSAYADRILAGLQTLEFSRDPDDRKVAIWNDLLPVLLEARRNRDDFVDVALEYRRVLPLLRVRKPDVFLDSYWGELWILNILLDSRIGPVVDAARQQAPEPAVVEAIFQSHAPALSDPERKAFGDAVSAYETAFKTAAR